MRITKWARKVCRAARRADAGRRTLAGLMAAVMTLGLVNFVLPEAKAADTKDYEAEKEARETAYNDKFNMTDLSWKDNSARTYMCWATSDTTFGGIVHRNYIHVYAFEGETITFGSNICDSTLTAEGTAVADDKQKQEIADRLGEGATVDIVLIDLHGNRILYDVMKDGKGHIPDYQTEVLAKTMEKVTGNEGTVGAQKYTYTPLTYEVRETGVYTFEFHSQDGSGTDTDSRQTKNGVFADDTGLIKSKDCGGMVDAWDISVFNEQGYKETGRVYADYLDFQEKGDVNESYYVLTSDNYIYRWDFKKAHPYTYNFFANNQGLLEKGTDHILYKSVKDLKNDNSFDKFGITYTYPGTPDTELTKSYKIFFEMPDTDLEGELYDKAVAPDPASNLKFVTEIWDEDKKDYIPGTYVGRGGWFQFDVENATTATLRIEFVDTNHKFGKQYAPVEISQVVTPYSTNRFFWDGRDGNGVIIPEGEYTFVDLSWTVTTKAGEIHFPIVDVEDTTGGFTFTRVSPVYDKNGTRVDMDDKTDGAEKNIYTATKSVIYYDNSAIYYGEKVARAGTPESDIILESGKSKITAQENWVDNTWDGTDTARKKYDPNRTDQFFVWKDIFGGDCTEYKAWTNEYRKEKGLRAGDHSHISNDITFYDTETGELVNSTKIEEQRKMIDWLDSAKNPVAKISGSGLSGSVVSDFSIQNFWTFVPGQPVTATDSTTQEIVIKELPEGKQVANITGLVFYDNNKDGKYNDKQTDMDVPLAGVTVNLYRQTDDETKNPDKTYYTVTGGHGGWKINPYTGDLSATGSTVYELVRPDTTDLTGRVIFENQLYDATNGTKFAYQVISPNSTWKLTSGKTPGAPLGTSPNQYGNYALYAYDKNEKGTEIQVFTLGENTESGMVNPENNLAGYEDHTATAIDVGYHYTPVQSLKAVKSWKMTTGKTTPPNVVYELSYYDKTNKKTSVYEERSLSSIMGWENVWNYLPDTINGHKVEYYISAEYYLDDTTLYKHTFELDTTASELTYKSFVGEAYSRTLSKEDVAALDYGSYTSLNDGNWIDTTTAPAPYTAVLDRNPGTAETVITITNSDDPGVIQILKYTGALTDKNFLQGATFRLYTNDDGNITIDEVQTMISEGKLAELEALQVGSATTRENGKVAFAGLNPNKHYVLREVYAPAGYRVMEELYLIHPAKCDHDANFTAPDPGDPKYEDYQTWISQNGRFSADYPDGTKNSDTNFIEFPVGNIPASGNLMVRKRIAGRAWNTGDSFNFNIAFRDNSGKAVTDFTSAGRVADFAEYGIVIDASEIGIVGDDTTLAGKLTEFAGAFKEHTDVTVNYSSDNYVESFTIPGSTNQTVETAYPDIHQSFLLLTDGKPVPLTTEPGEEPAYDYPKATLAHNSTSSSETTKFVGKGETFPAAGTYTFTISENDVTASTLSGDSVVYTVVVKVKRVMNPGREEDGTPNADNSHLEAEVTNITYREVKPDASSKDYPEDYKPPEKYMGASPLFTNTYQVQPAIQSTSYAITKEFTGRLNNNGQLINSDNNDTTEASEYDDGWLEGDCFYVTIEGADDTTKEALNAGNIYIGGLFGKRVDGTFDTQKVVCFNQTNVTNPQHTTTEVTGDVVDEGHTFNFEEIDFQNLKFPTAWEYRSDGDGYAAGTPVVEDETHKVVYYTPEDGNAKYVFCSNLAGHATDNNHGDDPEVVARTEDIVYKLEIKEYTPDGANADNDFTYNGIKYDQKVYTLVITLKNAVNITTDYGGLTAAVTDGIIDELDFDLYECAAAAITETSKPEATCTTDQKVVTTFDEWANATFDNTEIDGGWTKKWYYVNNSASTGEDHPVIREATVEKWKDNIENGTPTEFSVDIPGEGGNHRTIHIVKEKTAGADENYYTFEELNKSKDYDITFIAKREGHTGNHVMTFSNTYQATGTWTPTIKKTLNGRDWLDGESFEFTITATGWPGKGSTDDTHKPEFTSGDETVTIQPENGVESVAYTAEEIPTITFNAPGTYTFTIIENTGDGLGHGKQEYGSVNITVVAEDNNDGTLTLKVTGEDGKTLPKDSNLGTAGTHVTSTIHFVNTYSDSGKFNLAVEKTLTGKDWDTEEFDFTIETQVRNGSEWTAYSSSDPLKLPEGFGSFSVIAGDPSGETDQVRTHTLGTVEVGNLRGKEAKYRFIVKETTDSFEGNNLYCAQPTIYLTVTVTPNLADGKDEITATYAYLDTGESPTKLTGDPLTLPFTNRYYVDTMGPSEGVEGTNFTVTKEFTGRPSNAWTNGTKADTFSAAVTFSGDAGLLDNFRFKNDEGEYVKWEATHGNVTFTESEKSKTFDFRFFEEGEYKFTVKENVPTDAIESDGVTYKDGITYDKNEYTVTFTVTPDTDDDNRLTVTRKIDGGDSGTDGTITFKNTYKAEGTWTPTVTKELTGRAWQDGETFEFTLSTTATDGVTLPTTAKISVNKDQAETGVSFGAVEFTKAGDYTFTITESGKGSGLGKEGTTTPAGDITIKVNAEDNGDGTLKLTVTGEEGTVPKDSVLGEAGNVVNSIINFVNAYSESGTFDIAIEKTLTGRDWVSDDEFKFTVTLDDAAKNAVAAKQLTMPTTSGWENASDGTYTVTIEGRSGSGDKRAVAGELKLGNHKTKGATYVFTVKEETADFASQSLYCAQPEIKLTVTVTSETDENGYTGALLTYGYLGEAEPAEPSGSKDQTYTIPFTNRYYVDTMGPSEGVEGTNFTVKKEFTGRPADKWNTGEDADTFSATVTFSGDADLLDNFHFKNDAGEYVKWEATHGNVTFTESEKSKTFDFRFFEVGEYKFTVKEEAGSIAGVTYDTNIYTVTFNVTKKDDGDHSLTVTRKIDGGDSGAGGTITFVNTYEAKGTWTPKVTKELKGREWLDDDEFEFTLKCDTHPETYNPLTTEQKITIGKPSSGKENSSTFGAITFTKPGAYTFTITESGKGKGTLTTDPDITLTVNAEDNGDGTLKLTVTGEDGTTPPDTADDGSDDVKTTIKFVNTYSESGEFPLSLSKLLTGRDWESDETFSFTITPLDDTTKQAIKDGPVTVPTEWVSSGDGKYTVTIGQTAQGEKNAAGWETKTLDLGSLQVGNLGGGTASYIFIIEEDTEGFEAKNLYCAQPKIKLTVNVDGSALDGKLKFSATYAYIKNDDDPVTGGGTSATSLVLPFTNQFYVETLDPSAGVGDHGFTVAKSFTGRPGDVWNSDDVFKVDVEYIGSNTDNFQFKVGADYIAWDNATHGTVEFIRKDQSYPFDFRFFEEGEYKFTVKETVPEDGEKIPGVTYDENTYTVTFNVTPDTDDDNRLTVSRTIKQGDTTVSGGTITFKNTYVAKGTWTPSVHKTLKGRDWESEEKFTFGIECTGYTDGAAPTFASKTVEVPETGDGSNEGTGSFGEVTFKKPGTYTFTITETDTGKGLGKGTKPAAVTVTVEVTDNNDGTLNVAVKNGARTILTRAATSASNTFDFTNTYVESGSFCLAVYKTLDGRDWIETDAFTFKLEPDDTTLAAIGKELSVPASWMHVNNYYTVTSSAGCTGSGTKTTKTIDLGELTVTNKESSKESAATPRVYTFTVSEVAGDLKNLTYDTAVKTVTVTATRKKTEDGKYNGGFDFEVKVDDVSDSNPSFTNRCYAGGEPYDTDPATVNSWFAVAKNITGREWLTTGESYRVNAVFSTYGDASQMEYSEDGGNTYLPMTDGKTFDFTLTDSGAVNSPIFRFYAEGKYTFTLTEVDGGKRSNGVTYDDSTYTVTFDVAKTGDDNHLTVTRTIEKQDGTTVSGGTVTFTNEYAPDPAKWGPTVIKELTGRDWMEADEFKFTLTETEEKVNPEGLEIADGGKFSITDTDVDTAGRHTVTPELVTFSKPGTYYLTITEDSDEEYGIKVGYKFRLEVRVRDDQESGKLVVDSISSETDPNVDLEHPGIMFRNVYSEQGKFDITLIKFLNGRALAEGDEFTFTVTPDPDTKKAIGSGIVTVPAGFVKDPTDDGTYTVTVTGKDAGSGYAMSELGELSVKRNTYIGKKTTYGFVIKEVGLPDNTRPVQAELHVQMTMSETIDETTGLPTGGIEMTYAYILPDDSTLPVNRTTVYLPFENYAYTEAEFSVEKTFRDDNWPVGKEFSAEVTLTSGNGGNVRHKDMTVLPEGGETLTFTETEPTKNLSYVFLAQGVYEFAVHENQGTFGGVSYDDNVYTVTVTVTDDGAGHLTAKVSESTVKLVNIYTTSPAAVELTAEKIFVSDRGLKAGQFGFTLEATAGAPMPAGIVGNMLTIRNDVHGNVDFGSVEYTAAGIYEYRVWEVNESLPGVTYDERVYTVTVTVTDNYDGQLLADVKYTADGESADQIVFHNTRGATPDPAPVTLGIRKTVSGSYKLNAGDFAFTVTPSVSNPAGDPIGELAGWDPGTGTLTVRNGEPAGNTATAGIFEDTLFEVTGKYVYTVVEYIPVVTDPRMSYDASIYTVTVDVAGNTKLEAAITAEKDGETVALGDGVLDFTNIYGTAPSSDDPGISVALRAQKTLANLAGEPVAFENGAFTFVLNPLNGAPMPGAAEATVSSNGRAVFEGITFTAEGVGKTYEYEMREKPKEADGVVCDGSVWHVKVAVTQSSDGKLAAEITYEKDGTVRNADQGALFENLSYEPVKLTVQKTVGGLGDKEMAFNFKVEFTLPEGFDRDLAGIARIADAPDGLTWGVDPETGAVTLEFALKHSQLVTVENLPTGIGYKVTEAEADRDGYRTYIYGAETGDLSVDGTVRFFNTIPDPGDPSPDPGDPSPDPGDPSPDPGDPSPDPGDPSPDPGDPSPDPGGPSPDPGGPSPDPGDPSPDPGGPSPDPGDPSPDPGDPSPDPGDPSPDPGDPSPDPGDPPRDNDKTSDETPKTGDNSHPWLWAALMLLSLTGAVVTSFSLFGKRSIACSGKRRGVSLRGKHMRR